MLLDTLRFRLRRLWRECALAWIPLSPVGKLRRSLALLPLLAISLAVSLLVTGCSLPEVSAESRLFAPVALEFVDSYTLPKNAAPDVGGLSGLAYDRQKGLFYAVSDDRSNYAPARFYTLKPQMGKDSAGQSRIQKIDVIATTTLKSQNGAAYERGKIDAEGIVLSPRGTVLIASEGNADNGLPPSVSEYDLTTGKWLKSLPLPATYVPQEKDDQDLGIQNNKGFESLAINTDATADLFRIFVAVENPLEQDQTILPPETADEQTELPKDRLRMMHYALISGRTDLVGEYVYELDPGPIGTIENGLSDILSIDNAGRFFALERSLGLTGFNAKIYQFTFAGARDVQTLESLQGLPEDWSPVQKRLMLDLSTLGVTIDNVEGMTLGPKLADGSRSLWIVSDDNFDEDQVTQFLLFRLRPQK
ncbi:esterase-like activity of phytase family protein [filamentous cyanobacterium LEGE 11480]|uniref:Esterase-like activity of phytase family protein n=2 Tax=Romeriopsis TaxID=2992131 RepID=A0A928VSV0_9CYAN|nr:esterase-like activity of phytase family protein [Romeriopsis navalis LEGE 11480]